jgi:hypothetical protein
MERVTDREFAVVLETTVSSTGQDRHGDVMSAHNLEGLKRQFEEEPELRLLHRDHEPDQVIGEIIDVWLTEDDDEESVVLLKADVGVFEGKREAIEDIATGKLGGMSVTIAQYRGTSEDDWEDTEPSVVVDVPAGERHYLDSLLLENEFEYRLQIQKEAAGGAIFELLIENEEALFDLAKMAVMYYLGKNVEGVNVDLPNISLVNIEANLDMNLLQQNVIRELAPKITEGETIEEEDVEDAVEEALEEIQSE